MKYLFNNVIFTPNEEIKLRVDGEAKNLSVRLVALLQYFLDTNEQFSSNQEILDAVWGEGEHRFETMRTAISRLNQLLPDDAQIKNSRLQGYGLNVELKKVEARYRKTELILEDSPFVRQVVFMAVTSLFLISVAALGSWAGVGQWIEPPDYTVQNIKPVFTRDYLVGVPQLSPDGNFIAHRQSNGNFENAHLAITDLQNGETQTLAKIKFFDGSKWSPSGDKLFISIVRVTPAKSV